MIRKLASGKYRLYSRKANPKTGKRRNLGTFKAAPRPKSTSVPCSISNGIDFLPCPAGICAFCGYCRADEYAGNRPM